MSGIYWRGHKLTQQQLDLLVPLLNEGYNDRRLKKEADKAFTAAGCAVPELEPGTPVSWVIDGQPFKGEVIEHDERAGKVRIQGKIRKFTVSERDVRCIAGRKGEEPDE